MLKKIKKTSIYKFLLVLILCLASFLRFYRLSDLLGFWYDQGRDALVIWDMLYNGKFTLIGPMMGFTGIFRGAWYYYLIAPFYAFGHGNPIYASIFLIFTTVVALYLLYRLGRKFGGEKTGLLAVFIATFSMYLIGASRWLSDPTPTLLISVLLVWSLFKYTENKKWALPLSGFLAGMAMQFSAAAEVFYVPAIILIVFLFRKKIKADIKSVLITLGAYILPFAPQLLFEMRHPGVQSSAFLNFVFNEGTFTYAFWEIIKSRILFDYNMFASKFWVNGGVYFAPFFVIFLGLLIFNWKKLWVSDKFKMIFILATTPLVCTLFFVSNMGGVYEYYFTGYYLVWILMFSYVYINFFKNVFIKITTLIFTVTLFIMNISPYAKEYSKSLDNPEIIAYSNQLEAVDWIYKNAGNRDFNVDEYVPPVIPYAYQYLFRWLGSEKYERLPQDKQVPLLYTLYEVDLSHPERLQAWLDRQKGIGNVIKEQRFGGIVVQERIRINE